MVSCLFPSLPGETIQFDYIIGLVQPPTVRSANSAAGTKNHAATQPFCSHAAAGQAENFLLSDKSPTSVVAWFGAPCDLGGGWWGTSRNPVEEQGAETFRRNQPDVTMKKWGGFVGRCKVCFQGWGVLFCRFFRVEYVKLQVDVGDLKWRLWFHRFYGVVDQLGGRIFS